LIFLAKAVARKVTNSGKPLSSGKATTFRAFDDRQHAMEEMSQHDDNGWVVLCSVPVGIRAVAGLITPHP
jgi:hypothetical protein